MRAVWFFAIAIAMCMGLLLQSASRQASLFGTNHAPLSKDMVFVGSSLFQSIVPADTPPNGIFGDGRTHTRLVLASIQEWQSNWIIDRVLASKPKIVFVEGYPYIRDFNRPALVKFAENRLGLGWIKSHLIAFSERQQIATRSLTFRNALPFIEADPEDFEKVTLRLTRDLIDSYPLRLREPDHPGWISAIVGRAKTSGVCLVFLGQPYSEFTASYLGEQGTKDVANQFAIFRSKFGVQVWKPADEIWPNSYFLDRAHLNFAGRQRYLKELGTARGLCS